MVIIGSKGFAKEVLEVFRQQSDRPKVVFYDDISTDLGENLYGGFGIIKSLEKLKEFFKAQNDYHFTLGIGNPLYRKQLDEKISDKSIGGKLKSVISPFANIGHYNTNIATGASIMTGSILTNDIIIHRGCLINLNCTIGHDSILHEYVELSPGVHVSGNCEIGDLTVIGTNATILPNVKIGKNATIGAGTVVTKDVPDNAVVVGVPGKVIKIKADL